MNLLVISHVVRYRHAGRLWAYGPYAREIDLWAGIFANVRIASPYLESEPASDCVAFEQENISIAPQPLAGGETAMAKLGLAFAMPAMVAHRGQVCVAVEDEPLSDRLQRGILGDVARSTEDYRKMRMKAATWARLERSWGVTLDPAAGQARERVQAA
jgi:hypothetical protein